MRYYLTDQTYFHNLFISFKTERESTVFTPTYRILDFDKERNNIYRLGQAGLCVSSRWRPGIEDNWRKRLKINDV